MAVVNWREKERTIEDYRKFFREYQVFVDLFGQEIVDKHLVKIPFNSLVTVEHYRNYPRYLEGKSEELGTEPWTFEEWRGEWRRDVRDNSAWTLLVPAQYQGLKHSEIIKGIVKELYPWMDYFRYDAYELRGSGPEEFYLQTDAKVDQRGSSLYVPWKAFLSGNSDAIWERMLSYWRSYNRDVEYAEKVLKSAKAQFFFKCIQGDEAAIEEAMSALKFDKEQDVQE